MSLPNLPAGDKLRREVRTEWGGLNLNENAGDGELIEALNMSSREYPLLATRRPWYQRPINRINAPTVKNAAAFGVSGNLFWVAEDPGNAGTYKFYYGFAPAGTVSAATREAASKIRFACLRDKIYVFPDKKVYDETAGTWSGMEASWSAGSAQAVIIRDGTYAGVLADCNTIDANVTWSDYFRVGDAVTISGTTGGVDDKTAIIREIQGDELRFYENTFSGDYWWQYEPDLEAGSYWFTVDGESHSFSLNDTAPAGIWRYHRGDHRITNTHGVTTDTIHLDSTTQTTGTNISMNRGMICIGTVTITRTVPDMDYVCVNENRLWGCKGDTIYASALGNPVNFNVFDGLSTDSWTAETGTPGDFTGCFSYQGYPIFFKENCAFRVMGDMPSNFTLRKLEIPGVLRYSDRSLAAVGPALYYLSNKGICSWDGGGYPSIISLPLGIDREWLEARAGTDGVRYYISLYELTKVYVSGGGSVWHQYSSRDYCYDYRFGTWHRLNISREGGVAGLDPKPYIDVCMSCYAQKGDILYFLDSDKNNLLILEGLPESNIWNRESDSLSSYDWTVTFADSTRAYKTALTGSEAKKGVLRLLIRCRLAGTMKVWIAYDGGDFEEALTLGGEDGLDKTSRVVPLILRRCDFWQMKLTGTKEAVIYSIAVERYGGEWQQAE